MTDIAIVVPYREGCPHRARALDWTLSRYQRSFPDAPLVLGTCNPDLPFNRSEAIIDGASNTSADVLIVADGDCWSDGIHDAIATVVGGAPWVIPHLMLCRLSEDATSMVLAGEAPDAQDDFAERPYKGHAAGTLLVIRRDVLLDVPPDVRMVGWGSEDDAWALALNCLVGAPWRGTAPLYHLWHPPQPRRDRSVGNETNLKLYQRYKAARHNPERMRALIDEGKEAWHAGLQRAALDGEPVPH